MCSTCHTLAHRRHHTKSSSSVQMEGLPVIGSTSSCKQLLNLGSLWCLVFSARLCSGASRLLLKGHSGFRAGTASFSKGISGELHQAWWRNSLRMEALLVSKLWWRCRHAWSGKLCIRKDVQASEPCLSPPAPIWNVGIWDGSLQKH